MGIVHETGHARYEQRLPREWVHLPLGQARSMGVHESQSLSFEMQLGRSRPFLALIAPLVREAPRRSARVRGRQPARGSTRACEPGLIRVDADELTYPVHVILRFEIERALIEGEIEPEDVPALWDEKMHALPRPRHARQLHGRLPAGHPLDRRLVRLLPELHARRDVRGAVLRGDARAACPTSTRGSPRATSRRSSTGSRRTSGARRAAGETPELIERATGAPLSASALRAPPARALPCGRAVVSSVRAEVARSSRSLLRQFRRPPYPSTLCTATRGGRFSRRSKVRCR